MSTGIVTIATCNPIYAQMTSGLARSVREKGKYDGEIVILTDMAESEFTVQGIARIQQVNHGMTGKYSGLCVKTQLNLLTPFDTTLFLDADVSAQQPISEIWEYAKSGDIWLVRDQAYWPPGITPPFPPPGIYYNTGLILWNSGQVASRLFKSWYEKWAKRKEWDQTEFYQAQIETLIIPQELPRKFNTKNRHNAVLWHQMGVKRNEYRYD